jgi:hypothetical protein
LAAFGRAKQEAALHFASTSEKARKRARHNVT